MTAHRTKVRSHHSPPRPLNLLLTFLNAKVRAKLPTFLKKVFPLPYLMVASGRLFMFVIISPFSTVIIVVDSSCCCLWGNREKTAVSSGAPRTSKQTPSYPLRESILAISDMYKVRYGSIEVSGQLFGGNAGIYGKCGKKGVKTRATRDVQIDNEGPFVPYLASRKGKKKCRKLLFSLDRERGWNWAHFPKESSLFLR